MAMMSKEIKGLEVILGIDMEKGNEVRNMLKYVTKELPHWEDMLRYLDDEREERINENRYFEDEIDIKITNCSIKLNRLHKKDLNNELVQLLATNSIDVDPVESRASQHNVKVSQGLSKSNSLNRPKFLKVSQKNVSEMEEIEEQNSSFSSINDCDSFVKLERECNDISSKITSSVGVTLKSPAYWRRSAAELKIKDSILSFYTNKAHSILKDIKDQRHMRPSSWASIKNYNSQRNSSRRNLIVDIPSPFKALKGNNIPTPTEITSAQTINSKPSNNEWSRRTRECRNKETIPNRRTTGMINNETSLIRKVKTMQSSTAYKGPKANAYCINMSSNSQDSLSWVFETNALPTSKSKRNFEITEKCIRKAGLPRNQSQWFYKASSLLPGTGNLRVSQDTKYFINSLDKFWHKDPFIPLKSANQSFKAIESPFPQSNRSSYHKLTVDDRQNERVIRFAESDNDNSKVLHDANNSKYQVKFKSCNNSPQRKTDRQRDQKTTRKTYNHVLKAQVNLDYDSSVSSYDRSLASPAKFWKQKWQNLKKKESKEVSNPRPIKNIIVPIHSIRDNKSTISNKTNKKLNEKMLSIKICYNMISNPKSCIKSIKIKS